MEVRESSSKVLGFNGLQGDPLSFRKAEIMAIVFSRRASMSVM